MQPPPAQLSVRDVRKSFAGKAGEVRVLDDLSFAINERDFVSIIGPSGCGKTTIFNIIAGLLEPDSGSLHYRGEEIESLRGRVGYMMQKDLLFPWRTVLGNVLLGLETRGVDRVEAEGKAARIPQGIWSRRLRERLSENPVRRHAPARRPDPHTHHGSRHPAAR
jgi:NitT/TauT family transport system ATP-binding protein